MEREALPEDRLGVGQGQRLTGPLREGRGIAIGDLAGKRVEQGTSAAGGTKISCTVSRRAAGTGCARRLSEG